MPQKMNIKLERAEYNKSPHGSKKLCVMVEFPDCISQKTGKPFKWMPTYKQLEDIKKVLDKCEKISWGQK